MYIGGKDENSKWQNGGMAWKNSVIFSKNMWKMVQLGRNENNVLEHVSLDEDLVDHCLTTKKSHNAAKKTCIVSASTKRTPFHFIQHH